MVEELDVEILEQESFADVAAQFLDENGYLRLLAPRCSGTAGGNDTVSYTVVSNTVQIHHWLSGYGPSAFVFDHNSSGRSKGTLEVLAGGVGTTATDVLLQLKGPPMEIWSALRLFLQRTLSCDSRLACRYQLVLLIDRVCIQPPPSRHVKLQCERYITIGHALRMNSSSADCIMDYIHANVVALDVNMALNKFIGRQQDSHVQELVEYRGIACVCSDEESHGHNGDGDDSFEDQKENNIADIRICKHVQLTRKEITYLIGKRGTKISKIREISGAVVKVVPLNTAINGINTVGFGRCKQLTQFLRVSGSSKQVNTALSMIETEVYHYRIHGVTDY